MKNIGVLLSILLITACGNHQQTDTSEGNNESEVSTIEKTIKTGSIPSVRFDELEPYLNTQNDSIYVVNFWATWCKPCVKELPAFEKITKEYASEKVKVILVSLDFPDKKEGQLLPFIHKKNIQSQVLLLDDPAANYWIPKVNESWTGAIPATLIFSASKRKFYEQSFTYETLENELQLILNHKS